MELHAEGEEVRAHPSEIMVGAPILGVTKPNLGIEVATKIREDQITAPVHTEAMEGGVAGMTQITEESLLTKPEVVTLGSSRVFEDVPANI